ncbi:MAG: M14 family metallopeptidase, partial [Acidobacteriota bacterium]
ATALRLAHPEGLSDADARRMAREGKAVIHIDGGLHATEVAHAQHTIQLAHDLAAETEDPEILAILDNVVLLLWPSINPDGQTLVADWYRSNLKTPYEVAPMPRLYQKYVGHDNNRDGYMLNTHESRVSTRVIRDWEPQILYNHHQTSPFPSRIWIPPFAEPISEFVHPLMWRTVNLVGMSMAQALEERGQKGAVHMGTGFDNWYPGFMDHANNFHNVAAFLTETGLYRYATPHFYTIADFPERSRDLRPQSLYASPWEGGWWRLRDAVDYMLTASISVLDVGAKYKFDLLYNRYQAGRDVTANYRRNPPYAYFIPQDQRDPVAAVELLRRLAYNGIEVSRLTAKTSFEGQSYPAGTWVVAMDQPFAHFARQLFAVQTYPDLREYPEGPPDQPYDVSGWTLPYMMGVQVIAATTPLDEGLRQALEPVRGSALPWDSTTDDASSFDSPLGVGYDDHPVATAITPPDGKVTGSGSALHLDPAQNNTFRAVNRAWGEGADVAFLPGKDGASGRYVISGLSEATAGSLVDDLALQARRGGATGRRLARPRIGLYRPWDPSMDEGWTRWLLERHDFRFDNLYNAEMVAGNLHDRFDVIALADISPKEILEGFSKGSVPPRYHGGLAGAGVRALDAFVRQGGTLVTMNRSALFAIEELHLPVENVVEGLKKTDFFMGGSILEMIVDPSHPVMSGMPQRAKVFVDRSPVFSVTHDFKGAVLAKYSPTGSPLLSGYLLGEEHLHGYASALDVRHGKGHVILLGLRPQWRGQPFGTFRILFNAALYSTELAAVSPDNPDFWSPPEQDGEGTSSSETGR